MAVLDNLIQIVLFSKDISSYFIYCDLDNFSNIRFEAWLPDKGKEI